MNTSEYISERVSSLVKKHGTNDPFKLCKALDIRVRYAELDGRLCGYFFCQSRIKSVVLDSSLSDISARIICAHELGHACLHKETLSAIRIIDKNALFNCRDVAEYEADLFAAELLITDSEILEHIENGLTVYSSARALRVPDELLDFKLRSMSERGFTINAPYTARADFLKNRV